MKPWIGIFAAVLFPVAMAPAPSFAEGRPATSLSEATVRNIFRLVVGQPQVKDAAIGLSADWEGIWTCVWTREADAEVVVLQIRDADGACRRPDISDLSSLKFGMRLDLKERIAALIEKQARAEMDEAPIERPQAEPRP